MVKTPNTGRPSPETTKTVVMWALGKLSEELALYIDLDMIKKGKVSDGLIQEHRDVVAVHRGFLDNKLTITKVAKAVKEKKNA